MPTILAKKKKKKKKKEYGCTDVKKIKEIPEYSRPYKLRANSILETYTCLTPPYKI